MNFKQEDLMENKEELHVDSDADEALSFCDLPLNEGGEGNNSKRLSSDYHAQDFFEFFNDLNSEMNSVVAEDIMFCGKLLPYRSPPPLPPLTDTKRNSKRNEARFIDEDFPHRRSFSLSESRNSTIKGRVMSNSNLLDYRKLQKTSSSKMTRTPSAKSEKDQQQNPVRNVKPKWHLFMFGIMKAPTEMELSDIRNRQSKRIPSPLFPVLNGEETVTVKRDGGKRSSWSVFRALGCKGANAVAVVTASLGCLPHVFFLEGKNFVIEFNAAVEEKSNGRFSYISIDRNSIHRMIGHRGCRDGHDEIDQLSTIFLVALRRLELMIIASKSTA